MSNRATPSEQRWHRRTLMDGRCSGLLGFSRDEGDLGKRLFRGKKRGGTVDG